jgi:hypothetical protein
VLRCTAQSPDSNAPNLQVINAGLERAALKVKIVKLLMTRPGSVCAVGAPANPLAKEPLRIALVTPASRAQPTVTARAMSDVRTIAAKDPLKPVSAIRTARVRCRFVLKVAAFSATPIAIATRDKRALTINALVETKDAPQIKNVLKTNAVATASV